MVLKLCFYLNLLFRFHFFVNVSWYPQASYVFTQVRKYKDNDDVDIIFKVTNTPSNIEYGLVTW